MEYFYLKLGKKNWLADDWLAGRNPLNVPAAVVFFDRFTLADYEAGKGKKQPRRFVERARQENRESTRMVVISKGRFFLLRPAGEVRIVRDQALEESESSTVKAMPVEILRECSVSEVPLVLAEISANRYYGSGTLRQIKDEGNLMAIDWVEGGGRQGDHWRLTRIGPDQIFKCLGNVGLETLVAKSLEVAGCFVPAYRGGQIKTVDIFAHNHGDQIIRWGPLQIEPGQRIAIQVKRRWNGKGCPQGADYLVAIGPNNPDARVFGSQALFDLAMGSDTVKNWLLRSLDWLPQKIFNFQNYRRTWFRCREPQFAETFAIVTPDNPDGERISDEDNDQRNRLFERKLAALEKSATCLEAGSEDFSHREKSYVIELGLPQAVELGREFRQDAIFWVDAGDLFLVDCDSGEREFIAPWGERLVSEERNH